jgi:formylglycine-generating enzyme required for sulfatase activity
VGIFPNGFSKQGIADLAGNVEEWVETLYTPYPNGRLIKDRLYEFGGGNYYILRGGCYTLHGDLCLASRRHGFFPDYSIAGFRISEDT